MNWTPVGVVTFIVNVANYIGVQPIQAKEVKVFFCLSDGSCLRVVHNWWRHVQKFAPKFKAKQIGNV
jgi:hypothetical protein